MGGSAIGGALARAALGDRASRPIIVARDYALPPWTTPDTTVLCSSYSGETEETLAAYEAAGALGARRIVCTTGGTLAERRPRRRRAGHPAARRRSSHARRWATRWSSRSRWRPWRAPASACAPRSTSRPRTPSSWSRGGARTRRRTRWPSRWPARCTAPCPQITGAGLTAPIAYRWKTQFNENAKCPCFAAELPELDHNEIVGWEGARDGRPLQRRIPRRLQTCIPGCGGACELTRELVGGERGLHRAGRERRREPGRAAGVARPARRPGVDLPGGPAGRRSGDGLTDRALKQALAADEDYGV